MVNPLEVFSSPQMLHAVFVHFPVVLGILGVPLLFLCVLTQMKNATLRWLTFACYAGMGVISFATILTGEAALSAAPPLITPRLQGLVYWHQALGQNLWIAGSVTALFVALCGVKSERMCALFTMLAVVTSFVTALGVIFVAHLGTALVYDHGVGTAPMTNRTIEERSPGPDASVAQPPPSTNPVPPPPAPAPVTKNVNPGPYTEWIRSWWRDTKSIVWPS